MKTCKMLKLIDRYADGESGNGSSDVLKKHIAECAMCGERVAQAASLKKSLGVLDKPQIPLNFAARVMAVLEEEKTEYIVFQRCIESISNRLAPVFATLLLMVTVWAGIGIHDLNVNMEMDEFFARIGTNYAENILDDIGR